MTVREFDRARKSIVLHRSHSELVTRDLRTPYLRAGLSEEGKRDPLVRMDPSALTDIESGNFTRFPAIPNYLTRTRPCG